MKKGERRQEKESISWLEGMADFVKGGVIAGVVTLLFLLLCACLISAGAIGDKRLNALLISGCIAGSFTGGKYVIHRAPGRPLVKGAATGAVLFLILLISGALVYGSVTMSDGGGAILAACLCGGLLAAVTSKKQKKKKRKSK